MKLTEFLLARIAEDEAAVVGFWRGSADPDFFWGPDRIRAECEAKRRIVAELDEAGRGDFYAGRDEGVRAALASLAAVYADHPDYREDWTS